MKTKEKKLVRFNTENLSTSRPKTLRDMSNLSPILSTNKLQEAWEKQQFCLTFAEKSFNLVNNGVQSISRKLRIFHEKRPEIKASKFLKIKNETNYHSFKQFKCQQSKRIKQNGGQQFCQVLKAQIRNSQKPQQKKMEILQKMVLICDKILEEIYSYKKVQELIQQLNRTIKELGSKSLTFLGFYFSAQCLFMYNSYSLSIFYSDKALKILSERQKLHKYQGILQTELYSTITRIFMTKSAFTTAKKFAYKYLRKAWLLKSYEKQIDAYDLLGKIYHECEQIGMSIYFHNKMCKGQKQDSQVIKISNYEFQKIQQNKPQYAVYETIEVFVEQDQTFHKNLQERYRMKKNVGGLQEIERKTQFYFHTNRSPNRNLDTYRILQRRLIEEKKSKELHFIKPRQRTNLRKIICDFTFLLNLLKQKDASG